MALARQQYDKALAVYSKSIELEPGYAVPWLQRGKTWAAKKEYAKALADYEKAIRLGTKDGLDSRFCSTLALFRAACPDGKFRDGKKGLEAAQKAYKQNQGFEELAALAAAHAELGQFEEACRWQTKAVASAPAEEKERYRDRLKLYQGRKPYRLEWRRATVGSGRGKCITVPGR
jgi:tetratricopeptide (TPR) repeat protein